MDIIKALAIGAKGVLLGRPVLWALACGGAPALEDFFGVLKRNLQHDLSSLGLTDVSQLSPQSIYWKDRERIFRAEP